MSFKPRFHWHNQVISIWLAHGVKYSIVVPSLLASLTFIPFSQMSLIKAPAFPISLRWKVYWLVPIVAIGFTHCSSLNTILSMSRKGSYPRCFWRLSITGCPKVMFWTKCSCIISRFRSLAPETTIQRYLSAKLAKWLLRMDEPISQLNAVVLFSRAELLQESPSKMKASSWFVFVCFNVLVL